MLLEKFLQINIEPIVRILVYVLCIIQKFKEASILYFSHYVKIVF